MSSKSEMRVRRPSIDELVALARAAGKTNANRTTIHHWVRQGYVDAPVRHRRDYRYPLRAVGQVHTLARFSVRSYGRPMVRFALFVETAGVAIAEALAIAADWTGRMGEEIARARNSVADTDAYRREVQEAATRRGRNSVLPRQVMMSAHERMLAVGQLAAVVFEERLPGVPDGLGLLERAIGLRSGHGGAERELTIALTERDISAVDPCAMHAAVLAATPARARIARNMVELFGLWFPALAPSLLTSAPAGERKFLEIVAAQAARLTPEAYVVSFAGFLALQSSVPENVLQEAQGATEPVLAMVEMLAAQPSGDLPGVLRRLGPLQRLKLELALSAALPRR
jgi:hypothetical protein